MPNRILRDWTTSETVDRLTAEQENAFTRLLMAVDDFGRYNADPRLLLARLYPLRVGMMSAQHMHSIRNALAAHGLVTIYAIDGREYLQIVKWHNVPRAKESKFPTCTADAVQVHSICYASAPVTVTGTVDKEPETENRKPEPIVCTEPPLAATVPPSSPIVMSFACTGKVKEWHLTEAKVAEWQEAFPGVNVLEECRKAKCWEDDNPSKRKTAKGHSSFLNRWLSKTQDRNPTRQQALPGVVHLSAKQDAKEPWQITKEIEQLRKVRADLWRTDFESDFGRSKYPEAWQKVCRINEKIKELEEQARRSM